MIASLNSLSEPIHFMIPKCICITDIDIVRAIHFIGDNQKIVFSGIIAFTLDAFEESLVQEKYLNFSNVFLKYNAKKLELHNNNSLLIVLEPRTIPFFDLIYNILKLKPKELKLYLGKNLPKNS